MGTTDPAPGVVEVIYALPEAQHVRRVALAPGGTVREALEQSGLLTEFPALAATLNVGIHGERARLEDEVNAGDRIELYRPLQADPKVTRRRRAAKRQRD